MLINSIRGKYVKKGVMEPVGVCDRSGFWFSKSDLCKQFEWRGNKLVWTGMLVGRPFLDEPNEQNRPPKVSNDPKPVKDPRPMNNIDDLDEPYVKNVNDELDKLKNIRFDNKNEVSSNPDYEKYVPILPTISGDDISTQSAKTRIARLNKIRFDEEGNG